MRKYKIFPEKTYAQTIIFKLLLKSVAVRKPAFDFNVFFAERHEDGRPGKLDFEHGIVTFAGGMIPYVNIHTHRPTGRGIELRTTGVHPWDAAREPVDALLPLAEGVQAIGETGLDALRGPDRETQLAAFRAQLALARETGLPVVLHCVRSFGEVMRELAGCEPRAAIFHGFIGSAQQAREAVARGYYLSFGERAFASTRTLDTLRSLPSSQLFLETDDSPVPIEEIYHKAAEVRGAGVETLLKEIYGNYERIFCNG